MFGRGISSSELRRIMDGVEVELAAWSAGPAIAIVEADDDLRGRAAACATWSGAEQSGGHTISAATAKILNSATGRNLAAREWGRAVEALKLANGLASKYHGQITEAATYLDDLGNYVDDIESYLP